MAKPIEISLVSNVRGFIAGTEDASKALDDVSESLDDIAKDAKKAADKAGDGLANNVRDGEQKASASLERLESSFRELATKADSETDAAARSMGTNIDRGANRAKESMREVKGEALQNASETFSSFDGSARGLVDGVQGTFGGVIASLGPVGAAAGVAGAIGIGLISAALDQADTDSEAFRQKVSDLTAEFIKTGRVGGASVEYIADQLQQLATSTDQNGDSLGKLYQRYKTSGSAGVASFEDVAKAIVGAGGNYDELLEKERRHLDALNQAAAQVDRGVGSDHAAAAAIDQKVRAQQDLVKGLESGKAAADGATTATEAYAKSGAADLQAKADGIKAINDQLSEGADDWQTYYDETTGAFDSAAYVANYQLITDRITGVASFLQESSIPEAAKAYLQQLPAEQAAAYIGAYKAAQPGTQAQLSAIWAAQGQASGDSYVASLKSKIPASIPGPTIAALVSTPDWAKVVRDAQNTIDRLPKIRIGTAAGRFGTDGI